MTPTTGLKTDAAPQGPAARLGEALRARRKALGISMTAAAEAAGVSRVTWHRLEKGEAKVAWGSLLAAATVLGMTLRLEQDGAEARKGTAVEPPSLEDWLPLNVRLDAYPGLRRLAWQLRDGVEAVGPREAWEIYERNWRHLDAGALEPREQALIDALRRTFGQGRDGV